MVVFSCVLEDFQEMCLDLLKFLYGSTLYSVTYDVGVVVFEPRTFPVQVASVDVDHRVTTLTEDTQVQYLVVPELEVWEPRDSRLSPAQRLHYRSGNYGAKKAVFWWMDS